ncbi:MAG: hypothetical protein ACLPVY_14310 [Acidimicrobiia bacterium]
MFIAFGGGVFVAVGLVNTAWALPTSTTTVRPATTPTAPKTTGPRTTGLKTTGPKTTVPKPVRIELSPPITAVLTTPESVASAGEPVLVPTPASPRPPAGPNPQTLPHTL